MQGVFGRHSVSYDLSQLTLACFCSYGLQCISYLLAYSREDGRLKNQREREVHLGLFMHSEASGDTCANFKIGFSNRCKYLYAYRSHSCWNKNASMPYSISSLKEGVFLEKHVKTYMLIDLSLKLAIFANSVIALESSSVHFHTMTFC